MKNMRERWDRQFWEGKAKGMTDEQAQDYADDSAGDLTYEEELDADERDGR